MNNIFWKYCCFLNKKKNKKINIETENYYDTTFIKCIFHDLRTPLNNISMGTDLLLHSKKISCNSLCYAVDLLDNSNSNNSIQINEKEKDILIEIKENCKFIEHVLNSFLCINSQFDYDPENIILKMETFNLHGLFTKMKYLLYVSLLKKNITLELVLEQNLFEWVYGDQYKLQHVFMNLLSNSIKFSSDNTTIHLKCKTIMSIGNVQKFIIEVIDENVKIPSHISKHLFEKYNTSDSKKGSGLGLYISKKITEKHGGNIYYERKQTKNIFTVVLLLETCVSSTKTIHIKQKNNELFDDCIMNENENISLNNNIYDNNSAMIINKHISSFSSEKTQVFTKKTIKILFVDDSNTSLKMMEKIFETFVSDEIFFHIHKANDGLDALIQMKTDVNSFDIVITDNIMPNLTGPFLARILRGLKYTNLIFGLTGNGTEQDIEDFLKNGANYVYIKPFSLNKFEELINFIKEGAFISPTDDHKLKKNENGQFVWNKYICK
jgi:CheY-like chemotaxis protein